MEQTGRERFGAVAVLAALLVGGCASGARPSLSGAAAECYALLEELDARVQAAGAGDASLHRVPGFPYLRSTRFLASFAGEVDAPERFDAWIEELRAEDQFAREEEILAAARELEWGPETIELKLRTAECGETLMTTDLADPARRARLRAVVRVPDDYSTAQRVLGAYPVAALFLKLGLRGYHDDVRQDYVATLAAPAGARLVLWQARPPAAGIRPVAPDEAAQWMARAAEHPLGIPVLEFEEIERLLHTHAPAWWVEEAGAADRPGAPRRDGGVPAVDPAQPQAYVLLNYTRFGGRVLPQLVYMLWFAERAPAGRLDPYAGALDGLVWRVTLGPDGAPLVYDTIHPCGCYHHFFPARALTMKPQDRFWQEPVLVPQGPVGSGPLALRIAAGTHFLRRVVPLAEAAGEPAQYAIAPYGELTFIPGADERPYSLFDGDSGLVRGSERPERWWLWPSGVPSPGTMRAWGRHATAFIGRRHFDEAFLLEQVFEVPADFAPASPDAR